MKAAIVTIGDEILIGQIVDTNSSYIAKALDKIGIATYEMISISDDKQHILDTFYSLQNNVEVVIVTGGLGPTKDDITKKTFCDYFKDTLGLKEDGGAAAAPAGGSTTGGGVTNGATFTPGTGEQYAAGTRKKKYQEDAPRLAGDPSKTLSR